MSDHIPHTTMSTVINLRTHALMIMPGRAHECMLKLNQIDIYPSSVVQTNTSTHCLVVVPQYAVAFIQEQLTTCSCYFEPPVFATTVEEVNRLGMFYRQINEVYVEIGSPHSKILAHMLQRVIPFIKKREGKTLEAHAFRCWKGFIKKIKLLREKQARIHAMQSQLEEAQMFATRAKCARLFSGSLIQKHREREMVGRAFAKWVLRAQALTPPQSPRTPPKSPKKKKKISTLEKEVRGVRSMNTLRAFLNKHCSEALTDLEDALAMAEATVPHAAVLKESNGNKTTAYKKTTYKKSSVRKLLSLINRKRGKKSLEKFFGELIRFMSDKNIKTLDDLLPYLKFKGTIVMKKFKNLNTVPLPEKWTLEERKDALDYLMFRAMGGVDNICLYEWVLSKHPGIVPDLTEAVGTIAEAYNAIIDSVHGTHFDLFCEIKKYLFQTLGRETPYVRRIPTIDALKMVERCIDDGHMRGRYVIGGISCDAAVVGMLQDIANGFSGRTDEEDQSLLAAICGGKEKASRLWSALETMKDVGAAAECPYLDSRDYESLMMERKLVNGFIDAEDDTDRYDMLRGLFGVFVMKQSDVRILKETMFQHRQLGERDEGALEAIAVSLNINDPNTSTLYSIFLHLMGRSFAKDPAVSLQPPRRGRSKTRKDHRNRSCSRTRSPQARSDPPPEMKSPPAATKA